MFLAFFISPPMTSPKDHVGWNTRFFSHLLPSWLLCGIKRVGHLKWKNKLTFLIQRHFFCPVITQWNPLNDAINSFLYGKTMLSKVFGFTRVERLREIKLYFTEEVEGLKYLVAIRKGILLWLFCHTVCKYDQQIFEKKNPTYMLYALIQLTFGSHRACWNCVLWSVTSSVRILKWNELV